ncbi:MAG: hypothetical protein AAGF07_01245 [Patescibacteria group bacterium]
MPKDNIPDQNHLFPESNDNDLNVQSGYVPMGGDIAVDQDPTKVTQLPEPVVPQKQVVPTQQIPPAYQKPLPEQAVLNNSSSQDFSQQNTIPDSVPPVAPQVVGVKPISKMDKLKKIANELLHKWWLVLIIVLALAVASVGIFAFLSQPEPVTGAFDNLEAKIEAPQTSPSGSPNRWKISLKNQEDVALQNITVSLNYDRAFRFTQAINPDPSKPDGSEFTIARLDAAGQGTSEIIIQFEGTLTGNTDEETLMDGTVTYTPTPLLSSANSTRSVLIQAAKTKITQPQVKVAVLPTQNSVQNGGEAEVNIVFQNTSERELRDIRIRLLYPEQGGFSYVSSQLQVADTSELKTTPDDGNNIWYIPSLPRLKEQTLKVVGKVFGADGVKATFGVNVDIRTSRNDYITLTQSSKDITIVAQPLVVTTTIENKDTNKLFSPGDTLNFVIDYRNKGTTVLRNVEILASVDDPANILDYSTAAFTGGDRGGINNRTIQWKGVNVPKLVNLSPQDGGQLRYSIRLSEAEKFIESGLSQNAYVVTPKVTASAENLQVVDFAGSLYKAKGLLLFDQEVVSKGVDPDNSRRETFTVTWTLKSRQTSINDVVVKTKSSLINGWLPSSITPAVDSSKLSYNDVTGDIIWQPGAISAYTGLRDNSPRSISFDLVVEAPEGKTTKNITLFDTPVITGTDDFTAEKYQLTGQAAVTK